MTVGLVVSSDYRTYAYTFDNQLVAAQVGPSISTYDYDVFGRRVGKVVNGSETRFLHAGDMDFDPPPSVRGGEKAEYDEAGALLRRYIPGGATDARVAYIEGSGAAPADFKYYHADRLGSVAALTDASGEVVDRYAFDPYGNEVTGAPLSG